MYRKQNQYRRTADSYKLGPVQWKTTGQTVPDNKLLEVLNVVFDCAVHSEYF